MATKKNILPPPINPQEKPITVAVLTGKLQGLFNDVKELVTTTVKGTENVLRKEMQEIEKRLDTKIDGVEKRLDTKIDGVEKRLDAKIDGVRTELKETEARLSGKIDKIGERLDDHEDRIVSLEKNLPAHP